jgi:hypothetical protein
VSGGKSWFSVVDGINIPPSLHLLYFPELRIAVNEDPVHITLPFAGLPIVLPPVIVDTRNYVRLPAKAESCGVAVRQAD